MAIAYIEEHWNTLYDELIAWNTEYGSVLNSEITTAWENCLAAAQRYGSYVSVLNNIGTDIAASTSGGTSGTGVSAPVGFCNFSQNGECKKMAGKGVQPLNDYTCRFRPSSLKCTDKSGLDGLQADKYRVIKAAYPPHADRQ